MAGRFLLACAFLLAAGVASADSEEVVTLRDGSKFRGMLVELVTRDHVTLKLATGEVRRFEWADIEKAEEVGLPTPAPAPPPAQGVMVRVDALSTHRAILQQRTGSITIPGRGEAATWADACVAPCNVVVPGGLYRLGGPGVAATKPFALPDHGSVRVDAKLGSSGGRAAGLALAITGGALMASAAVEGILAAVFSATTIGNVSFGSEGVVYGVIAGVSGGIGLLLLIPGIVLLGNSSSSAAVVQLARLTTTGIRF